METSSSLRECSCSNSRSIWTLMKQLGDPTTQPTLSLPGSRQNAWRGPRGLLQIRLVIRIVEGQRLVLNHGTPRSLTIAPVSRNPPIFALEIVVRNSRRPCGNLGRVQSPPNFEAYDRAERKKTRKTAVRATVGSPTTSFRTVRSIFAPCHYGLTGAHKEPGPVAEVVGIGLA